MSPDFKDQQKSIDTLTSGINLCRLLKRGQPLKNSKKPDPLMAEQQLQDSIDAIDEVTAVAWAAVPGTHPVRQELQRAADQLNWCVTLMQWRMALLHACSQMKLPAAGGLLALGYPTYQGPLSWMLHASARCPGMLRTGSIVLMVRTGPLS